MEISTVFMSLIVLALIIVPVYFLEHTKSKKGKTTLKSILSAANKNNDRITEYNCWNNYAIGIDINSKRLYYAKKIEKKEECIEIELSAIKNCKIQNSRKSENSKTEEECLVIDLLPKNLSLGNFAIEFYNSEFDGLTMHEELHLAQKWLKTISQNMNGNSK